MSLFQSDNTSLNIADDLSWGEPVTKKVKRMSKKKQEAVIVEEESKGSTNEMVEWDSEEGEFQ